MSRAQRKSDSTQYPSEGFPRLAYLGPGARWDRGREDFENSRRSARPTRALGPGPVGPWAPKNDVIILLPKRDFFEKTFF